MAGPGGRRQTGGMGGPRGSQLLLLAAAACLGVSAAGPGPGPARSPAVGASHGQHDETRRISGGTQVDKGEVPYHAAIFLSFGKTLVYLCGAAIVDELHLLTAAHCLVRYSKFPLLVAAGVTRLREGPSAVGADGVERRVARVFTHPEYESASAANDIALVRVQKALPMSALTSVLGAGPRLAAVRLRMTPASGAEVCTLSGWSYDADRAKLSRDLQSAALKLLSHEACSQLKRNSERRILPGMLCAQPLSGVPCQGDSGGPLVCGGQLVGIMSWGPAQCGRSREPVVFADVPFFLDWVRASAGQSEAEVETRGAATSQLWQPGGGGGGWSSRMLSWWP